MRLLQRLYQAKGLIRGPGLPTSSLPTSSQAIMREALALSRQLPTTPGAIAFVAHRDVDYLRNQWAIWLANHIAVPLSTHSARPEHLHILMDSGASHVIGHGSMNTSSLPIPSIDPAASAAINVTDADIQQHLADLSLVATENAMLLYTSGTTGVPKGVLATHDSLLAQVEDVANAWELKSSDRLLHFLPLHHTHGIVNNLLAPLARGATVECLTGSSPSEIWAKLSDEANPVTVLMAVPSIYMLLLEAYEQMDAAFQARAKAGLKNLRVAISGSMACPVSILERWKELSDGQTLLERYGMTECGMALGNPLHGERHIGYVGQPFPSIQARISTGELQVRGPTLFKEYWKRPMETQKEWTDDGWFKTGDIAEYNAELASYRILGRASVDIIKSAGYKISALEVEQAVLSHPDVLECAVYGVPDETWGQVVTAVCRTRDPAKPLSPPLADFLADKVAKYKSPRKVHVVDAIPKNAMGKVNKKQLPALLDQN
ncbi:Aste57867_290 [Aphanomyces stellatus]|uniref:Aste57867_290 protein n=1 Tax=Aphanomyces stellatus TaxID=120398 RepID=A0A485K7F1_9STRA|nr:hypothetical protein As57867_000290 [Aphanomyces stellatus]VFT77516.1 Aste57867_290 [Aphanomyces stellatus]